MSLVRNVASVVGLGVGVIALGFGLFADTSLLSGKSSPATTEGETAPTAPVAPSLDTIPLGPAPVAIIYQPPPGAVMDREIEFQQPRVEAAPVAAPVFVGPATPSATPAAASETPTVSWSNPGKPGEPMLDPNPVD